MRLQNWPTMKRTRSSSGLRWLEPKRAGGAESRPEAEEEVLAATRAGGRPSEPQGTLEVPSLALLMPSRLPRGSHRSSFPSQPLSTCPPIPGSGEEVVELGAECRVPATGNSPFLLRQNSIGISRILNSELNVLSFKIHQKTWV